MKIPIGAIILLGLVGAAPEPARAQSDSAAVLQSVQTLLKGIETRDTTLLKSVLTTEGRFAILVIEPDSVVSIGATHAEFIARVGALGPKLLERVWQPVILVHGALATFWAPYDFYRDGQFSHCGIDAFTLARTREGWKITGGSYTVQRTGCPPSPLGRP